MIDEQQKRDYQKSFERTITPKYTMIIDSKASNSNVELKTAEEMAMELLLERVFKLEKRVLELENKF